MFFSTFTPFALFGTIAPQLYWWYNVTVHTKEQGYIQEALVILELLNRGFTVSSVQGDNTAYELISDWHSNLQRIQVKSTGVIEANPNNKDKTYCVSVKKSVGKHGRRQYTKDDCDFIIVVIIPGTIFYVIPVEKIASTTIRFRPNLHYNRLKTVDYERYHEAWDLLK